MDYVQKLSRAFVVAGSLAGYQSTDAVAKDDLQCNQLVQEGEASWYGNELRGHKMANGKKFNPDKLTVANKNLPKGTMVKVVGAEKGVTGSVIAEVTDRGPYIGGRILDGSQRVASIVGYESLGTANVKVFKCTYQ